MFQNICGSGLFRVHLFCKRLFEYLSLQQIRHFDTWLRHKSVTSTRHFDKNPWLQQKPSLRHKKPKKHSSNFLLFHTSFSVWEKNCRFCLYGAFLSKWHSNWRNIEVSVKVTDVWKWGVLAFSVQNKAVAYFLQLQTLEITN